MMRKAVAAVTGRSAPSVAAAVAAGPANAAGAEANAVMAQLLNPRPVTLETWRDVMREEKRKLESDWRSKIPGLARYRGVEGANNVLAVFDALTPEELRSHESPERHALRRARDVAAASGRPLVEVEEILRNYAVMHRAREWVQIRRTKLGKSWRVAPTPELLVWQMRADRRWDPEYRGAPQGGMRKASAALRAYRATAAALREQQAPRHHAPGNGGPRGNEPR